MLRRLIAVIAVSGFCIAAEFKGVKIVQETYVGCTPEQPGCKTNSRAILLVNDKSESLRLFVSTAPNSNEVVRIEGIKVAGGKTTTFDKGTKLQYTVATRPGEQKLASGMFLDPTRKCQVTVDAPANSTVDNKAFVREATIHGYRAYVVQAPSYMGNSKVQSGTALDWRLPDIGCVSVKSTRIPELSSEHPIPRTTTTASVIKPGDVTNDPDWRDPQYPETDPIEYMHAQIVHQAMATRHATAAEAEKAFESMKSDANFMKYARRLSEAWKTQQATH